MPLHVQYLDPIDQIQRLSTAQSSLSGPIARSTSPKPSSASSIHATLVNQAPPNSPSAVRCTNDPLRHLTNLLLRAPNPHRLHLPTASQHRRRVHAPRHLRSFGQQPGQKTPGKPTARQAAASTGPQGCSQHASAAGAIHREPRRLIGPRTRSRLLSPASPADSVCRHVSCQFARLSHHQTNPQNAVRSGCRRCWMRHVRPGQVMSCTYAVRCAPHLQFFLQHPAASPSQLAPQRQYKTRRRRLDCRETMRSESEVTVSPVAIPPRTSSRRHLLHVHSQPHSRVNSQSQFHQTQQLQSQLPVSFQPRSPPAQRHSFTLTRASASSLPRLEAAAAAAAATSAVEAEPLIELESEAQWLAPRSRLVELPLAAADHMSKRPLYPQPPPRRSSKRIHYGDVDLADMQHQVNPSAPPSVDRFAHEDFDFRRRGTWTDEKERIVRGPFEYVVSHPGKDFRSQIIAAFNAFLDVPPESLAIVTKVVGMLHEASLLVDDVQDSSELRRGFPVAHNIFGVAQTINSANYIYFAALQELVKLGNKHVIALFAEELINLHRGQGMDLFWRDTLTCPTEDDYLEMVGNKTGGLFRLGIKLMQAESTSAVDCVPLVDIIGLIFQIRDDYMNLSSSEYSHNKGMCEDLTEGKFSFPVIHSIRADPVDLQLINILKQKTTDVQVKRYAVSYMDSKGSFEYTRQVVATLIERARKMVAELDDGSGRAAGIYKILDKMVIST
ncbi:isoprenoid synthase domain-containing protein [Trichoderma gracile]